MMRRPRPGRGASLLAAVAGMHLLAACSTPAGPDYHPPQAVLGEHWSLAGWREARPADDVPRGPWWHLYQDAQLDALESDAERDSPTLQAALARVKQAQALVLVAQSAAAPQIGASATGGRNRTSANRPFAAANVPVISTTQNDFTVAASARWETDLAGGVRRSIEAAQAAAGQAAADAQTARLLISSGIASNYFALRALDADVEALQQLLDVQQRTLDLAKRRVALGQGTALDVSAQSLLLDTNRVQLDSLQTQRGTLVAALAALTGKPAPDFQLAPATLPATAPHPPIGLPLDLLERRPDIASAERAVAQASAQIGVAAAARYPDLTLSGNLGSDSRTLARLFDAPSLIWAVGASAAMSLSDGGRIDATVTAARAAHEASVAHYRDVVLGALSEVQGALAAEQTLASAVERQAQALKAAREQLTLIRTRHAAGLGTLADELVAEQSVRISERALTQLQGQQLLNSVFLIKALGGQWQPLRLAQ